MEKIKKNRRVICSNDNFDEWLKCMIADMEEIKKLTNKKKVEFKKKLKALLKEYDVNIQFVCSPCSDTYGIYDGGIAVCENKTGNQVLRAHDWYLDENNI